MTSSTLTSAAAFFQNGGPFMILLVALSLLSTTAILLRLWKLRESAIIPPALEEAVEALRPGQIPGGLQQVFSAHPSALARILETLLQHLNWSKSENLEAVQTKARHELARMEKGLVILEIATATGPLLGLLGTLSGLVGIFSELSGSGDPAVVARGISEALNTTIVGLAVAVPSAIAHSYFQRRIEMLAIRMESIAADLLAKVYQSSHAR